LNEWIVPIGSRFTGCVSKEVSGPAGDAIQLCIGQNAIVIILSIAGHCIIQSKLARTIRR
jgi:hypothetical protein